MAVGLAMCLLVAGCGRRRLEPEALQAAWVIADTVFEETAAGGGAGRNAADAQGGFFRFYPDGAAAVLQAGAFRSGHWSWDAGKGRVTVTAGAETLVIEVGARGPDELSFRLAERKPVVSYVVRADRVNYDQMDPYSAALNAWRVPAKAALGRAEMDARLLAMLDYLNAYFLAASIHEVESVEVANLPTPFLFAGNGIALYRNDRLPEEWLGLFASRTDAILATERLGGLFRGVKVPVMANRFERNALIFSQLAAALRKSGEKAE